MALVAKARTNMFHQFSSSVPPGASEGPRCPIFNGLGTISVDLGMILRRFSDDSGTIFGDVAVLGHGGGYAAGNYIYIYIYISK